MSNRYTLTLTEEQLRVVDRACDVLHRLHMGQFDPILSDAFAYNPNADGEDFAANMRRRDRLARKLRDAEPDMTALPAPGFHAIGSEAIGDSARVAYDIVKVIRYLAWQEGGEKRPSVYGYPVRRTSPEPLPLLRPVRNVAGEERTDALQERLHNAEYALRESRETLTNANMRWDAWHMIEDYFAEYAPSVGEEGEADNVP